MYAQARSVVLWYVPIVNNLFVTKIKNDIFFSDRNQGINSGNKREYPIEKSACVVICFFMRAQNTYFKFCLFLYTFSVSDFDRNVGSMPALAQ